MHAVFARKAGEAEVGDDHPLRGEHVVAAFAVRRRLFGAAFPGLRGDDVDAGLQFAGGLEQRKLGRHVLVALRGDRHRAAPDLDPVLRLDFARPRHADRLEEIVALHRRQQVAVADPVNFDRHFFRVDRGQRRAELARARQHVAFSGEMRLRRAVLDVDFVVGGLEQRLAHGRRHALAQHDGVALAMLDAFDADLLVVGGDRRAGRAGHRDIGREVGFLRQGLGEGKANPRRGGFIVDLVFEDAEAVLLAQVLVGGAGVDVVAPLQARLVGVEGGPPHFVPGEEVGQRRQRLALRRGRAQQSEGRVGGGSASADQIVAVIGFGVVGLRGEPCQRQPVRRVLGGRSYRGARQSAGQFEIACGDGCARFGAQKLRALGLGLRAELARLLAQRLDQADGVAGHPFADIGLDVGGERRRAGQDKQKSHGAANDRRHASPKPNRRRRTNAYFRKSAGLCKAAGIFTLLAKRC